MAVKDGITDFHLKESLKIGVSFPLDGVICNKGLTVESQHLLLPRHAERQRSLSSDTSPTLSSAGSRWHSVFHL